MFAKTKRLYRRWVKVAKRIAAFQIKITFTAAYYAFIVPYGKIFKKSSSFSSAGWHKADNAVEDIEEAKRQF